MMQNPKRSLIFFGFVLIAMIVSTACGPAGSSLDSEVLSADENVGQVSDEQLETEVIQSSTNSPQTEVSTSIAISEEPASPEDLANRPDSISFDDLGIEIGFTADGHPYKGDLNAPIVIKEYSDYQCPFCSRFFNETLPSITENQIASGQAVLIFYDYPLNAIHPQAEAAANAARCAGEQGIEYYWAMHDSLFSDIQTWSNSQSNNAFIGLAGKIGIHNESFEKCITSNRYEKEIRADLDSGSQIGITSTPSFSINGQILVGAQPITVFNNAIATILEGGAIAADEPRPTGSGSQPVAAPTPAAISDDFAGAMGNPNAPVTIVEFTDYQCPFCSRHSLETLPAVVQEMVETGRVYYVLKDYPLDQLHPNARIAAAAARCAGEQDSYWEMHDSLFVNQAEWAAAESNIADLFSGYATELALNTTSFADCVSEGRYDAAVEANFSEGRALGVSGTPFFFINGYPLNGARPIEHFQIAVQYAEEGRLAEVYAPQPTATPRPSGPQYVSIDNAFSIGDPEAPITIVEFTDFQCPFCSRHFQQTYPHIVARYVDSGIVQYVFKDFPLTNIHPQAVEAAQAVRCAGDQGAYLEMHDAIFSRQQEWSDRNPTELFVGMSGELALDEEDFRQCLESGKYESAVAADLQEGLELGISGTPTFFINGYPVVGAQPFTIFEQTITSLLQEQE